MYFGEREDEVFFQLDSRGVFANLHIRYENIIIARDIQSAGETQPAGNRNTDFLLLELILLPPLHMRILL